MESNLLSHIVKYNNKKITTHPAGQEMIPLFESRAALLETVTPSTFSNFIYKTKKLYKYNNNFRG